MSPHTDDILARARRSYQMNRAKWSFLGYSEAIAVAVLAEFFAMGRVRNPSQKPLNVLSMVGKSRVKAIADTVQSAAQEEGDDDVPDAT